MPLQDFIMTTAQHLRRFPTVWPVTGPLLPPGTRVTGTAKLTTHWRQVRTQGGQTGWVLRGNTRAVPTAAVADFLMTPAQHLRGVSPAWPDPAPPLPPGTRATCAAHPRDSPVRARLLARPTRR